jgi:hypothetical protein
MQIYRQMACKTVQPGDHESSLVLTDSSTNFLYQAYIGRAAVSNGTTISVFVDDYDVTAGTTATHAGNTNRTWYDGVSYALVTQLPTPPTWTPLQIWQMTYFGCTNCPAADPSNDFDGDGMNNLQEFLAATDPTNSASAFRILSVTPLGNDIHLLWQGGPGKTAVVQAASTAPDGFAATGFADISAHIVIPASGITNHLDAGGATNVPSRFYRVRLAP